MHIFSNWNNLWRKKSFTFVYFVHVYNNVNVSIIIPIKNVFVVKKKMIMLIVFYVFSVYTYIK